MIRFADSEGPDQTAWMRRLIWASTVRIGPKTNMRNGASHMSVVNEND